MRLPFVPAPTFLLILTQSVAAVAGELKVERVFGPEIATGPYKHPACLTELDNGDLYLVYYGGEGEYAVQTAVFGSRRKRGRVNLVDSEADRRRPVPVGRQWGRLASARRAGLALLCGSRRRHLVHLARPDEGVARSRRDVVRRLGAGERAGDDGPEPADRAGRRALPPPRLSRDRA